MLKEEKKFWLANLMRTIQHEVKFWPPGLRYQLEYPVSTEKVARSFAPPPSNEVRGEG